MTLSNDLKQIELEINHHKNIAGQSVWEIGRRLNHVKENDLVHGEFRNWHESIGIDKDFAFKSMKVAKELPNVETLRHLGTTALHLIATLPDEAKQEQLEKIDQGETPTVRELQSLKRQLRQKDMEIIGLKNQAKPETIVKTVEVEKEVIPDDYESLQQASKQLDKLKAEHQRLLDERAEVNEKSQKYDQLNEAIAISQGKLNATQKKISEYNNLHKLIKESNDFLTKASGLVYADISGVMESDPVARQEIIYLLGNLERFTKDLNQLLETNLVIEGEIIND